MTREMSAIIKEWKDEAGVEGIIQISRSPLNTLKICTSRPGQMIGLCGNLFDKYKEKLKEICPKLEKIDFVETDSWYIK